MATVIPIIVKRSVSVDGVTATNPTNNLTCDVVLKFTEDVPAGGTPVALGFAFARAKVVVLVIDAAAPVDVYTNNAALGSATDKFVPSVNNEVLWWQGAPVALSTILTADVTGIWAANTGTGPVKTTVIVGLQV